MSEPTLAVETRYTQPARTRRNWPLLIGGLLVFIVLLLAIFGPMLAPKDPREHHMVIRVNDEWIIPPYSAFTPGFPLGSDNLGRDLYSWLLWSVRPTMILVTFVAFFRMLLGVVIGAGAGWSDGWLGRVCDALIAGALAVPALIAALIVITGVGFSLGVWAFVVGLAVTGWAEAAQLVREQTRTIRSQQAVEAAQALGASGGQIFFLHVLPQVMPMVWMLLAFEISNTLVTTAGLGFLGYYLGGAVFTEVDDFVYQRISEMPELGQMLATAWMVLDEPWAMVAAGTVVFLIVLGFNLLGEGLQKRLTRQLGGARSFYVSVAGDVLPLFDRHVVSPLGEVVRKPAFRWAAVALIVGALGTGLLFQSGAFAPAPEPTPTPLPPTATPTPVPAEVEAGEEIAPVATLPPALAMPGEHIWANEGHDPWHARWLEFSGPLTTTVQWTFAHEGGFAGGPVIAADGTLYIAAHNEGEGASGTLYALGAAGDGLWATTFDDKPVGSPALDAAGTLYVAGKAGLTAFSSSGEELWHLPNPQGYIALAGPVVGLEGNVYYKGVGGLVAASPQGELRWTAAMTESYTALPPHLSVDGELLLWGGSAFATADGAPHSWEAQSVVAARPSQVAIGGDGTPYLRYDVSLYRPAPPETLPIEAQIFDWSDLTWEGQDAGMTPDGLPWLSARPTQGGMGLGFFWGNPDGSLQNAFSMPGPRQIHVVAVDHTQRAFVCMDSHLESSSCLAYGPEETRPAWHIRLAGVDAIAGAALAPQRLYVATHAGELLAIGDTDAPSAGGNEEAETAEAQPTPPPYTFGPEPAWEAPDVPGEHFWPQPRRDAWGTLWADFTGPQEAQVRWVYDKGNVSGTPVVAADGTVYVGSGSGVLIALNPQGKVLWRVPLATGIVGSPAVGGDGTIYAVDGGAYLWAVSPDGEVKWQYHATGDLTMKDYNSAGEIIREETIPLDALSPAVAGPFVAPDGNIYFTMAVETQQRHGETYVMSAVLLAVSPQGDPLFAGEPPFAWPMAGVGRASPDGRYIHWSETGFSHTVATYEEEVSFAAYSRYLRQQREKHDRLNFRLLTGADGRAYMLFKDRTLRAWYLTAEDVVFPWEFSWNPENSPGPPCDAGVTPAGMVWMFFCSGRMIWLTPEEEVLGPARFPLESNLFAIDAQGHAYGCGSSLGRASECMALAPGSDPPMWTVTLDEGQRVTGGALTPDTFYVTTEGGWLYAIGE